MDINVLAFPLEEGHNYGNGDYGQLAFKSKDSDLRLIDFNTKRVED
jgi:hypothetical protein